MFGLTKEEIMSLLEESDLAEKQKSIIADIFHLNNMRIEQLTCIYRACNYGRTRTKYF